MTKSNLSAKDYGCSCLFMLVAFFVVINLIPDPTDSGDQPATSTSTTTEDPGNQAKWYEGGTLQKSTLAEWGSASQENQLATCADFMMIAKKDLYIALGSDKWEIELLGDAIALRVGLLEVHSSGVSGGSKVSEIAAMLLVIMQNDG